VKNKLIANRYALAFIALAKVERFDDILLDIKTLREVIVLNPDNMRAISSALFPITKRLEIIKTVSVKLNVDIWKNFLELIVKKHRFEIIGDILTEIELLIMEDRNQVVVNLTIARNHSDETMGKISKLLSDFLNKEIILNLKKDQSIIGGFVAETDTILIDGSIKNNLLKFVNVKNK